MLFEGIHDVLEGDSFLAPFQRCPDASRHNIHAVARTFFDIEKYGAILGVSRTN